MPGQVTEDVAAWAVGVGWPVAWHCGALVVLPAPHRASGRGHGAGYGTAPAYQVDRLEAVALRSSGLSTGRR